MSQFEVGNFYRGPVSRETLWFCLPSRKLISFLSDGSYLELDDGNEQYDLSFKSLRTLSVGEAVEEWGITLQQFDHIKESLFYGLDPNTPNQQLIKRKKEPRRSGPSSFSANRSKTGYKRPQHRVLLKHVPPPPQTSRIRG